MASSTRSKAHLKYDVVAGDELLDGDDNVLLDQTIRLTGQLTKTKYPSELKRTFTFLTNDFTIKAKDIAMLYKQRWQVELFFRWIKQHLHVLSFWGTG